MFSSTQVRVFFRGSGKMSRSWTDSIRGLWGARFERIQCRINPDRRQPVSSVVAHRHPHAVEA